MTTERRLLALAIANSSIRRSCAHLSLTTTRVQEYEHTRGRTASVCCNL